MLDWILKGRRAAMKMNNWFSKIFNDIRNNKILKCLLLERDHFSAYDK